MPDDSRHGTPTSFPLLLKALEATPSGVVVTDATLPDNPIVYANDGFYRMTGYSVDEVIGRNCRFLQGPETDPKDVAQLRRTIASGRASKTTLLNYRKDGSRFWNELTISAIREGGRVTNYIGIQTDVSDREAAIELQTALDLAENIYETVREPLLILTEAAEVFRANRAFYALFGLAPEEVEGRSLYDLDGGVWDIPTLRHLIERVLPTHNPFDDFEVTHDFGAHGRRTIRLNARRIVRSRLPEYVLLAMEDVTEQKRAREELVAKVEALDRKDREKDEFLAMLSHELRNPLNAISVALELAEPGFAGDEARESYEIATRQVANMSSLVNDLLEVARVTQGKVRLKRQRVSLGKALAATFRAIEADVPDDGRIRFVLDLDSGVVVNADPIRLDQIFQNLLGNAVKFTASGEIRLTLRAVGDEAVVRIRDTGAGIDPAFLPQMFELFQQSGRTLARSEGGLGIGLTVTKQLVDLHGGTIEAESEGLGRGATFTVRLPLDRAEAPRPEPTRARPVATRRLSVLVVDDRREAADLLAKLLRRAGHEARTAYHGDEVIPAIVGQRPDVVLLDIGLPGKDGYALAREIRQDPTFAATRLIAVTGYGQTEDVRRAHEAGFDGHLLKPVDREALLQELGAAAPPRERE